MTPSAKNLSCSSFIESEHLSLFFFHCVEDVSFIILTF